MTARKQIPDPALARITLYLRVLEHCSGPNVSSAAIAHGAGVNAPQVRKDLSYVGQLGQPGVGYSTAELQAELRALMGLDRPRKVAIVGAGALGSALITYPGFESRGFHIVAVFDNNPAKIGHRLRGRLILPVGELREQVAELGVEIAMLAVPRTAAQSVAEALVEAGIAAIVNFAPLSLRVPEEVAVRNVDLTQQLECLAYYLED